MESCVVEMRGGQIGTVSAPFRFEPESIRPAIRPGCESPVTRRIEITQISSPEWSTLKERVHALSAACICTQIQKMRLHRVDMISL